MFVYDPIEFLRSYYDVWRVLHIISVIAWMAGMLYLPRLFVYHADAKEDSELSETLKIMERRLMNVIMNPAMISTWIFGILIVLAYDGVLNYGWFHVKITAVILMSALHGMLSKWRKNFEIDDNQKSAKFFRIINEVPTVLMIIIVIMVVVKPF